MSRKEREKAAAAATESFAEAKCFVISAGAQYKRRDRAQHAAIIIHGGDAEPSSRNGESARGEGSSHPCVVWAPAARELFKRCVHACSTAA